MMYRIPIRSGRIMTAPTWRTLWRRLIDALKTRRMRFRYCADCGTTLTRDETVTCAECIEHRQAAWRQAPPVPDAFNRHIAQMMQPMRLSAEMLRGMQNMTPLEQQQYAMQHPPTALGHLGAIGGGLIGGLLGGSTISRALGGQQRPWWEC